MIDGITRGALMEKTPTTARYLISNMVENSQQFNTKNCNRLVHELNSGSIQGTEARRLDDRIIEF